MRPGGSLSGITSGWVPGDPQREPRRELHEKGSNRLPCYFARDGRFAASPQCDQPGSAVVLEGKPYPSTYGHRVSTAMFQHDCDPHCEPVGRGPQERSRLCSRRPFVSEMRSSPTWCSLPPRFSRNGDTTTLPRAALPRPGLKQPVVKSDGGYEIHRGRALRLADKIPGGVAKAFKELEAQPKDSCGIGPPLLFRGRSS